MERNIPVRQLAAVCSDFIDTDLSRGSSVRRREYTSRGESTHCQTTQSSIQHNHNICPVTISLG